MNMFKKSSSKDNLAHGTPNIPAKSTHQGSQSNYSNVMVGNPGLSRGSIGQSSQ